MRIESVTAHAFGPLIGQTLEFADGVTVVYGPNESAKSSWHAATFAALCGRAPAQGSADKLFVERHRPWDGPDWLVETRVRLDDGRRIRLRQNLLNNADRQAMDLDLGRDCSAEVMHDQYPDAAKWLGLDRESFRATACVAQAQILDVDAHDLTRLLQAAAATGGGQPVEAIKRIRDFHGLVVGRPRMRTPPLQVARDEHAAATRDLADANARHATYEQRLGELEQARATERSAHAEVERAVWVGAVGAAGALRHRVDEAVELTRRIDALTGQVEPGDDATSAEAAAALMVWYDRRAELAVQVPAPRAGTPGSEPADRAGSDRTGSDRADADRADADRADVEAAGSLGEDELWRLVSQLELPVPVADQATYTRLTEARASWAAAQRGANQARWLLASGAVGALAALILLVAGQLAAGVAVGVLSLAAAAAGGVRHGRAHGRASEARDHVDVAERECARDSGAIDAAAQVRAQAVARCGALGLPADPAALRDLIQRRRRRAVHVATVDQLDGAHARAAATVLAIAARLGAAGSGAAGSEATGSEAPGATLQLTVDEAVAFIEDWQKRRADAAERREEARGLERRLAGVLGDADIAGLGRQAGEAEARAAELRAALHDDEVRDDEVLLGVTGTPTPGPRVMEARLGELRQLARQAELAAQAADAGVREAIPTVAVAEAEERLAAAATELERLTELDDTLTRTLAFMEEAQEWAHRSIAPSLNESVGAMLPIVTRGRYAEVAVDPTSLEVTVWGHGGANRKAARLSYGTAEQIYLMLRIALAKYLVKDGMSAPLLFDDVTVHADRERTAAILDLLLAASTEHQVVVFTQQEQVRDWARQHLTQAPHRLIELAPVATV